MASRLPSFYTGKAVGKTLSRGGKAPGTRHEWKKCEGKKNNSSLQKLPILITAQKEKETAAKEKKAKK